MPELKSETFLFRMGATEARMLREIAEDTGLSKANVLRQLLRREHRRAFGKATGTTEKEKTRRRGQRRVRGV